MTKRAWVLVVLNILVPGSAQVLAGNRRAGRFALGATLVLWALAVVTFVVYLVNRSILLSIVTNSIALWGVVLLLAFYAVLWIFTTLDTLRLVRFVRVAPSARGFIAGLSVAALIVTAGGAGYAAANAVSAIGVLDTVFSDGAVAAPIDGRYNILLLGGDAGPDRMGMRPDSISVVSIDADTGKAVIFGVPRNLEQATFVDGSPLFGPFPNGYDCGDNCLVSYLYTYGEEHPDLYPDADKAGSRPGIEATRDAVEGILGLTLQYYVLIDMQGFADLIDALGGVDIDVKADLPYGANTFDDGSPAPAIGVIPAGKQHMPGWEALWYARSRYGSNDYERMDRQRQVQEAMLKQFDPANIVTKFQAVAAAGTQVVSTDIPQSMLSYFVELGAKTRALPIDKLNFVPPEFDGVHPDFEYWRSRMSDYLAVPDTTG
ncbi:MAG TPA: LCP family protein [Pseudolysinimonas sp.]|jgi:LCP family protein required for cell wall assembly|nr:LCP family protein [Pseudolysinimonas sp.]